MNKEEILLFLKENKPFLQQRFHVEKIGLFGSFSTETATRESDVDILVSMPSSFDDYYALKEFLESNLKRNVDLGMEKTLRHMIKKEIQNEIIYV